MFQCTAQECLDWLTSRKYNEIEQKELSLDKENYQRFQQKLDEKAEQLSSYHQPEDIKKALQGMRIIYEVIAFNQKFQAYLEYSQLEPEATELLEQIKKLLQTIYRAYLKGSDELPHAYRALVEKRESQVYKDFVSRIHIHIHRKLKEDLSDWVHEHGSGAFWSDEQGLGDEQRGEGVQNRYQLAAAFVRVNNRDYPKLVNRMGVAKIKALVDGHLSEMLEQLVSQENRQAFIKALGETLNDIIVEEDIAIISYTVGIEQLSLKHLIQSIGCTRIKDMLLGPRATVLLDRFDTDEDRWTFISSFINSNKNKDEGIRVSRAQLFVILNRLPVLKYDNCLSCFSYNRPSQESTEGSRMLQHLYAMMTLRRAHWGSKSCLGTILYEQFSKLFFYFTPEKREEVIRYLGGGCLMDLLKERPECENLLDRFDRMLAQFYSQNDSQDQDATGFEATGFEETEAELISERSLLLETLGARILKIFVIPEGLAKCFFERFDGREAPELIGYIGRENVQQFVEGHLTDMLNALTSSDKQWTFVRSLNLNEMEVSVSERVFLFNLFSIDRFGDMLASIGIECLEKDWLSILQQITDPAKQWLFFQSLAARLGVDQARLGTHIIDLFAIFSFDRYCGIVNCIGADTIRGCFTEPTQILSLLERVRTTERRMYLIEEVLGEKITLLIHDEAALNQVKARLSHSVQPETNLTRLETLLSQHCNLAQSQELERLERVTRLSDFYAQNSELQQSLQTQWQRVPRSLLSRFSFTRKNEESAASERVADKISRLFSGCRPTSCVVAIRVAADTLDEADIASISEFIDVCNTQLRSYTNTYQSYAESDVIFRIMFVSDMLAQQKERLESGNESDVREQVGSTDSFFANS